MKGSQRTLGVQGRGPTKQLLIAEQSTLIDPCSRYHTKHLTCACTCAQLLKLHPTLCDPLDCSPQAPLSTGLSRQEYWSGWLCPPPGDLPNSRIQPKSPMDPALVGRYGGRHGNPLHYSCLENPMEGGVFVARILEWLAIPSSRQLSN